MINWELKLSIKINALNQNTNKIFLKRGTNNGAIFRYEFMSKEHL